MFLAQKSAFNRISCGLLCDWVQKRVGSLKKAKGDRFKKNTGGVK